MNGSKEETNPSAIVADDDVSIVHRLVLLLLLLLVALIVFSETLCLSPQTRMSDEYFVDGSFVRATRSALDSLKAKE